MSLWMLMLYIIWNGFSTRDLSWLEVLELIMLIVIHVVMHVFLLLL
jgi:hypothetical protein